MMIKWQKVKDKLVRLVGVMILLVIISQVGIALLGGFYAADKRVMSNTAKAQENLSKALFFTFRDLGRLDVRFDHSVHVYILTKNYMLVPYPDRDAAITFVGKEWCDSKGINSLYLPRVELRDIQTGDDLGSYRCFTKSVSKK